MINNINKSTIILASNCRDNENLFKEVKEVIKKKFPNDNNLKMSILYTARMGFRNKSRANLLKDTKKMTKKWNYEKKIGIPIEYIDCSRYKNIEKCKKSIKNNKIIWIMGGDTLYLMYHLKKYGIDKLLKSQILKNNIVFVGCCAGAIISGKSINPTFIDRVSKKKMKYYIKKTYKKKFWYKNKNRKGLNLINNLDVIPHCSSKNNTLKLRKNKMYCLPEKKQLIINK